MLLAVCTSTQRPDEVVRRYGGKQFRLLVLTVAMYYKSVWNKSGQDTVQLCSAEGVSNIRHRIAWFMLPHSQRKTQINPSADLLQSLQQDCIRNCFTKPTSSRLARSQKYFSTCSISHNSWINCCRQIWNRITGNMQIGARDGATLSIRAKRHEINRTALRALQ